MSNSVPANAPSGSERASTARSWSPSGFDHHETAEARGCVMTSLSDDRIIYADAPSPWSPL